MVCTLNGQCSGICGGASFWEDHLTLAERGKMDVLKINDDDDDENPEGTQIIVGSMNMGYISDTAKNRTHNLFHPKREPIPLGHSDRLILTFLNSMTSIMLKTTPTSLLYHIYIKRYLD